MDSAWRRQLVDVADCLAIEFQLLEMVLYRLVEARLVFSAGETRLVPQVMSEVDCASERVEEGMMLTAEAVGRLRQVVDWAESATSFRFLTGWAPEPFAGLFDRRRRQFGRMVEEIMESVEDSRRLVGSPLPPIDRAERRVSSVWLDLESDPAAPSGVVLRIQGGEVVLESEPDDEEFDLATGVDELALQLCAYEMAGATLARSMQPSLMAFLR